MNKNELNFLKEESQDLIKRVFLLNKINNIESNKLTKEFCEEISNNYKNYEKNITYEDIYMSLINFFKKIKTNLKIDKNEIENYLLSSFYLTKNIKINDILVLQNINSKLKEIFERKENTINEIFLLQKDNGYLKEEIIENFNEEIIDLNPDFFFLNDFFEEILLYAALFESDDMNCYISFRSENILDAQLKLENFLYNKDFEIVINKNDISNLINEIKEKNILEFINDNEFYIFKVDPKVFQLIKIINDFYSKN